MRSQANAVVANTVYENNRNNIMKIFLSVSVTLMLLISTACFAEVRNSATIEKELKMVAKTSVQAYREGGMAELGKMVEDCYQKVQQVQYVCLYLDLASMHIDKTISAAMNYPPNDNFSNKQVLRRIIPVLKSARMDSETAKGYVTVTMPVINKLVDQELVAAANQRR